MAPKSILVTGANGLIGFELVKRLRSEGRNVVAVDRTVSDVRAIERNAFELEIGDIHRLHDLALKFEIDAIAHCGGVSGPMLGRDNPAELFRVNVGGTVDVAELARQTAMRQGSCRLAFCSSLTVYGDNAADNIAEDTKLLTSNCYALSKVAGEAIIRGYTHEHNVDGVILRIAGVYGPRRRTACVIRLMVDDALAGRATRLSFGKQFARQWVHVDDVVQGIAKALDAPAPSRRVYNISGGINPYIEEAARILREFLPGAEIELGLGIDPDDISLGLLSIQAAKEDLGYEPKVSLRVGIERLVASIRLEASHGSSAAKAAV
jgi:UDP-glucuronate 4-epimerase